MIGKVIKMKIKYSVSSVSGDCVPHIIKSVV